MKVKLLTFLITVVLTFSFSFAKTDLHLYELMYKSFIYTNDLENAYRVAKKVVKENPDNILWRKRLAQVALWLNKTEEAFKNYLIIYEKTKDKKIQQILLKFSYPQVVNIKLKNLEERFYSGEFETAFELSNLYEYLGYPEKSLQILKTAYEKTKNEKFLFEYLIFAVKLGKAKTLANYYRYVSYLPEDYRYRAVYLLISSGYYNEAVEALRYVENIPQDETYYTLLSYALFKKGDFENLIKLLSYIFEEGKISRYDIHLLVSYFYSKKDYQQLEYILQKAIRDYKQTSLVPLYLDVLIKNQKYKEALSVLSNYKDFFKEEKENLLLEAQILRKLGEKEKAYSVYIYLLENFQLSPQEKRDIFWFFYDNLEQFKDGMFRFIKVFEKEKSLKFEIAVLYLNLGFVDKAYLFAKEYVKQNPTDIKGLIFLADVLNLQTKFDESYFYYYKAWKLSNIKLKKENSLLKNKEFLKDYIRLSYMFSTPEKVKELFLTGSQVLSKKELLDLKVDYLFNIGALEPIFYEYYRNREERWGELYYRF